MFENVDGRTKDGRRRIHGYPISSQVCAFGSGELTKTTVMDKPMKKIHDRQCYVNIYRYIIDDKYRMLHAKQYNLIM